MLLNCVQSDSKFSRLEFKSFTDNTDGGPSTSFIDFSQHLLKKHDFVFRKQTFPRLVCILAQNETSQKNYLKKNKTETNREQKRTQIWKIVFLKKCIFP